MWNELWERQRGKCIGVACGVFFGFIYLICGLWDMLIFAFIVFIGYYMGKKLDHHEPFSGISELYQWLSERWRMFR